MSVYYIVIKTGFLKQYFSETASLTVNGQPDTAKFSASLRTAKTFTTAEEALALVKELGLSNALVIDSFGKPYNQ